MPSLEKMMQEAIKAVLSGELSTRKAADKFNVPRTTLQDRCNKTRRLEKELAETSKFPEDFKQKCDKPTKPLLLEDEDDTEPELYDARMKKFLEYIGETGHNPFKPFDHKKARKDGYEYKLVISDLHAPMHDKVKMHKAINLFHAEFGPGGTLIIAGDLSDGYSLSSHGQLKVLPFNEEMAEARVLLQYLCSIFEKVIVIDDNHIKDRWMRKKAKEISPDVHFLLDDPYSWLVRDIPNAELARRQYDCYKNPEGLGWFHIEGDCLIAHMTRSAAAVLKPAQNLYEWYESWRRRLGTPELRAFMEAHVHKLGGPYHIPGKDVALYETGCLAGDEALEYGLMSEGKSKPSERGVIFLVQQNGITDKNRTRVVLLEDY